MSKDWLTLGSFAAMSHLRSCRLLRSLRPTSMQTKRFHATGHPIIEGYDPQKVGAGAMLINNLLTSAGVRRRITVNPSICLIEGKSIVLAFIHASQTGKTSHA